MRKETSSKGVKTPARGTPSKKTRPSEPHQTAEAPKHEPARDSEVQETTQGIIGARSGVPDSGNKITSSLKHSNDTRANTTRLQSDSPKATKRIKRTVCEDYQQNDNVSPLHATSGLIKLPSELLGGIASFCERDSLAKLRLTHSKLRASAEKFQYIYQCLTINGGYSSLDMPDTRRTSISQYTKEISINIKRLSWTQKLKDQVFDLFKVDQIRRLEVHVDPLLQYTQSAALMTWTSMMPHLVSITPPGVQGPLLHSKSGDAITTVTPSGPAFGDRLSFLNLNAVLTLEVGRDSNIRELDIFIHAGRTPEDTVARLDSIHRPSANGTIQFLALTLCENGTISPGQVQRFLRQLGFVNQLAMRLSIMKLVKTSFLTAPHTMLFKASTLRRVDLIECDDPVPFLRFLRLEATKDSTLPLQELCMVAAEDWNPTQVAQSAQELILLIRILTSLESLTLKLPNFSGWDFKDMLHASGRTLRTLSLCVRRSITSSEYKEIFETCRQIQMLEVDEPKLCPKLLHGVIELKTEFEQTLHKALAAGKYKCHLGQLQVLKFNCHFSKKLAKHYPTSLPLVEFNLRYATVAIDHILSEGKDGIKLPKMIWQLEFDVPAIPPITMAFCCLQSDAKEGEAKRDWFKVWH